MATDNATKSTLASSDFLVRGSDYLAQHPGFKLEGRKVELASLSDVLMRKDNNNLVVVGQNGVGISSIILGLQASKEDLSTPFDIVGKRFYYLDVDALFSTNDQGQINAGWQKAMATLKRAPDTVLVIEDTKDFLDGIRNTGTSNIINQLMREARKNDRFQVIFEARNETLAELYKAHSDVAEIFSPVEIREPSREELKSILQSQAQRLAEYHGVAISPQTIDSVVDVTVKYPGVTLDTAQPKRSMMILEGALTALRRKIHSRPTKIENLENDLQAIATALQTDGQTTPGELADMSKKELTSLQEEKTAALDAAKKEWEATQKSIRAAYKTQRDGEDAVSNLTREIEALQEKEDFTKKKLEEIKAGGDATKIAKEFFDKYGAPLPQPKAGLASTDFNEMLTATASAEMQKLIDRRAAYEAAVEENSKKYQALTKALNEGVVLTDTHVLAEFSRLSGLAVNKLNEDANKKLLNLGVRVKERVFGQDEAVDAVTDYIQVGANAMKPENKPIGSFLFIGPTGVGKTELSKALAEQLNGDEKTLIRFDMGGFQEKNTVSTLVGAPRGYEGFAEGGLLTNAVRRRPNSVLLFDEVEKAHTDVYDVLLPVIDDGLLADTRGQVATFGNTLCILTSNIGAKHFMNPDLTYEEAAALAKKDLDNHFRPEFLARLDGIYYFKNLEEAQIVLIAQKELRLLGGYLAKKGITVEMAIADIQAMVADHNNKAIGGRGIRNYINANIKPQIAKTLMQGGGAKPGSIRLAYNKASKKTEMEFTPKGAPTAAANGNKAAAPAPKAAAR